MGREVRLVPKWWEHPRDDEGHYIPLLGKKYSEKLENYMSEKQKWESGIYPDYASEKNRKLSYEEWGGEMPSHLDYMPEFKDEEKTHLMMYENTTEGTPISPAFETAEELALWLSENNASAFGDKTAPYSEWLAVIRRGISFNKIVEDLHLDNNNPNNNKGE